MSFAFSISQEKLVEIRRVLHQHAESGLSEFWTTAYLAKELSEAGFDVKVGHEIFDVSKRMGLPDEATQQARLKAALEQGADPEWIARMDGITGLVVDLRPDLPMHTVLRFDIDAVDVDESSEGDHLPAQEGFRSINAGECHACAHDGHATIGLGTALELLRYKDQLKHNIRIIFEPAEEGSRGAAPMVSAGVVDGAKYFFSAHIGVNARQDHELVCGTQGFLATTKFDVEFFGRSSHSGADPHEGKNSLLAAASATLNMHAIPRHGHGNTRITVGRMESGTGRNVIPSYAKLLCETRGETTEINDYMFEKAKLVIEHSAAMYEQDCKITVMGQAGCAVSDRLMIDLVKTVSEDVPYFHRDLLIEMGQGFGTDDACAFIQAVQKQGGYGTYAQIGSSLPVGHHNQRFDFNENLLQPSVELFCRMALAMDALD
ncbi:amidohydrolase [Mailhella sp.]|uniref:amidohydrolase n=1 Tax=Mailhella sp. TaxID=1981029 RepID=UPI0040646D2F